MRTGEAMIIKELEDVLVLVAELPAQYQKEAAQRLAWLLKSAEEEMTMTEMEIKELRRMEREASAAKWKELRDGFEKLWGKDWRKDYE